MVKSNPIQSCYPTHVINLKVGRNNPLGLNRRYWEKYINTTKLPTKRVGDRVSVHPTWENNVNDMNLDGKSLHLLLHA